MQSKKLDFYLKNFTNNELHNKGDEMTLL